jgi:hypothetical protein
MKTEPTEVEEIEPTAVMRPSESVPDGTWDDMTRAEAEDITNRIAEGIQSAERLVLDIRAAYERRAWVALGLADWAAYVDGFDLSGFRLDRGLQKSLNRALVTAGATVREAARASGTSKSAAARDVQPEVPKPSTALVLAEPEAVELVEAEPVEIIAGEVVDIAPSGRKSARAMFVHADALKRAHFAGLGADELVELAEECALIAKMARRRASAIGRDAA